MLIHFSRRARRVKRSTTSLIYFLVCGILYEVLKVHGPVAQLVRAPPCHGGGRGFEPRSGRYGILAQLGEHLPYKQRVTGSSPVGPIQQNIYRLCRYGSTGRAADL